MTRHITIGTRASPLALAQTALTARLLQDTADLPDDTISVRKISTKGDRILDRTLAEIGGKGLFTDELNTGLRDRSIDLAVHSLKDLPTADEEGLRTVAILARDNPLDILMLATSDGPRPATLDDVPEGARIGTASLRRKAQILRARPDLELVPLRGNIGTRLAKLSVKDMHATVLAMAGLNRMEYAQPDWVGLSPDIMLPAAGQGALAVQCRADDDALIALLSDLDDAITHACIAAERSFLAGLDGSCRTPIAALATRHEDDPTMARLRGRLLAEDGTQCAEGTCTFQLVDPAHASAIQAGASLAADLRAQAPGLVASLATS